MKNSILVFEVYEPCSYLTKGFEAQKSLATSDLRNDLLYAISISIKANSAWSVCFHCSDSPSNVLRNAYRCIRFRGDGFISWLISYQQAMIYVTKLPPNLDLEVYIGSSSLSIHASGVLQTYIEQK